MTDAWDVAGAACLVVGAVLTFVATVGMVRYPDLLSRQHMATKPQVLALVLQLMGAAMIVRDSTMTWTLILVAGFQLITAPISAHMLSRAGFGRARVVRELVVDELREDMCMVREGQSGDNGGSR